MTSNLPNSFVERLQKQKVIPFVGAGVSMNITDKLKNKTFPSWFELLSRSEDALNAEKNTRAALDINYLLNLPEPDFYQAAKIAKEAMGQRWYHFLQTQLDHRIEQIDTNSLALVRAIWKIGSPFIITANYDRSLFWSCPNQDDFSRWDIENVVKQGQLLSNGLPEEPTVWHLHGHIDNPEKIILTLDGYLKLYPGKRRKTEYEAALDTLRTIMKTYSLLFIGFSLDDKFVNEQLIYVNNLYKGSIGPHYILTAKNNLSNIQAKNLPVTPITFSGFGQPLIDKVNEIADITNHPVKARIKPNHANPPLIKSSPKSSITPIYQRIFNLLLPVFFGLAFLGTFLDSISNAIQLITPKITYVLSILAILIIVIAYLVSRFEWLEWIDENDDKGKLKLDHWHYLQIIGVVVLLWIPRAIDYYNLKAESNPSDKQKESQQIIDSNKPNNLASINVQNPEYMAENTSINSPQFKNVNELEIRKPEKRSKPVTEKIVPTNLSISKSEELMSTARAMSLYNQRKYDEAISECDRILSIQPNNKKAISLKERVKNTIRILNQ